MTELTMKIASRHDSVDDENNAEDSIISEKIKKNYKIVLH